MSTWDQIMFMLMFAGAFASLGRVLREPRDPSAWGWFGFFAAAVYLVGVR